MELCASTRPSHLINTMFEISAGWIYLLLQFTFLAILGFRPAF